MTDEKKDVAGVVIEFADGTKKRRAKSQSKANAEPSEPRPEWESQLQRNVEGRLLKSLANVTTILSCHEDWKGKIAFNEFTQAVVSLQPPPVRPQDKPKVHRAGEWSNTDSIRTANWISQHYRIDVSTLVIDQAVDAVGALNAVHPVREWLQSLKWDAMQRLPTLFSRYFGAEQTPYTAAIGIRAMIGCAARIMRPGCKLDTVTVLEGPQGLRKSTAIAVLAKRKEWYSDSTVTIGDKDAFQNLRGKWLYELPELAAIKGPKDVEKFKAYFSSSDDNFRPSYGRRNVNSPRQCAFWATTNEVIYLVDRTGNRRFWPIRCTRIDINGLESIVDQLWAEALARLESGEVWWIDSRELAELCREQQADREQPDPWEQFIQTWVSTGEVLLPNDNEDPLDRFDRVSIHDGLTTADFLRGAIRMPAERINKSAVMRMGDALHAMNWERRRVRLKDGTREYRYFPPEPVENLSPPVSLPDSLANEGEDA